MFNGAPIKWDLNPSFIHVRVCVKQRPLAVVNQEVGPLWIRFVCPARPTDADLDRHPGNSENKPTREPSCRAPQTIHDPCLLRGRVLYSAD